MPQALRATADFSKTERAKVGTPKCQSVYQILPFELFLREIWPQDRTKNYMRLTGARARTAKRRLAGSNPDYDEIVAILRSDYGIQFVEHVMGDARPSWFASVKRARNLGDLRKQHADLQRRIAQMEMGAE